MENLLVVLLCVDVTGLDRIVVVIRPRDSTQRGSVFRLLPAPFLSCEYMRVCGVTKGNCGTLTVDLGAYSWLDVES